MSKLSDESKWRIRIFLDSCLFHVRNISKKPVSAKYLIRKYGDFMRMSEWLDVRATNFWWGTPQAPITTEDLLSSLGRLETM